MCVPCKTSFCHSLNWFSTSQSHIWKTGLWQFQNPFLLILEQLAANLKTSFYRSQNWFISIPKLALAEPKTGFVCFHLVCEQAHLFGYREPGDARCTKSIYALLSRSIVWSLLCYCLRNRDHCCVLCDVARDLLFTWYIVHHRCTSSENWHPNKWACSQASFHQSQNCFMSNRKQVFAGVKISFWSQNWYLPFPVPVLKNGKF